ncbi:sulfotransferase family protein [Desulfogranum marinum]|uniref:sulfotransferase family protein n=1 Tax=Desulfogranum marinum TaxID=453220 RepID=UPI0019667601|nr:sulfotransferase [Desulfogranum marinum]MBM9514821.1 sulfotransferase [Desulfogranum marinum]
MSFSPIFIVGNSRSGTTLLARVLSKHTQVHILNETHFLTSYEEQRKSFVQLEQQEKIDLINLFLTVEYKGINYQNKHHEYSKEAKDLFARCAECKTFPSLIAFLFKYAGEKKGKTICGDQTPAHIFYTEDILKFFPNAKFINIVRDPRAVLLSQKNKWKAAKKMHQPLREVVRAFFNYHPITTSLLWKRGIEAGTRAQSDLSPNVFHTIQFEQLLEDSEAVLQKLCSFIEVEFESGMLDVNVSMSSNETDEGKKGIRREVMNHWRKRLSETEIFISERINGELAEKEGYQRTHVKAGIFSLLSYSCYFPIHLVMAFLFNMSRTGNPISYISKKMIPHNH